MPVINIQDGVEVQGDTVYVAPPETNVALLHNVLHLLEPVDKQGRWMRIDFLFRSLAEDQGDKSIGIVLSGMGTDGTLGIKAIKESGGLIIAESPESAQSAGMPKSAIATGMTDFVLPPEQMPEELVNYVHYLKTTSSPTDEALTRQQEDTLQKVSIILRSATGHDFSQYKNTTMGRRVERRMVIHSINKPADYIRLLQEDQSEVETLFHELLIGVTSFFRDPEAFDALEKRVIPRLFDHRPADRSIRIWVPGCSTGEEAYSIAILIRQQMDRVGQEFDVQIFATDIDERAIDRARQGLYPPNIELDVPSQYLRRYFTQEGQNYQIVKQIRDMVIFAEQSVTKDPPFSKMDLISFRNVMIYFDPSLQRMVIPMLHYALASNGYLYLGTSETLGEYEYLFKALDRKHKIFERSGSSLTRPGVPTQATIWTSERKRFGPAIPEKKRSLKEMVERMLLADYTPPAVIITPTGEILYFHHRTGNYLEPTTGDAGVHILSMAREGLRLPLTGALRKVVNQNEEIVYSNLKVQIGNHIETVTLRIRPIEMPEDMRGLILVAFEPGVTVPEVPREPGDIEAIADGDQRMLELERELQSTQEYLQATIEELEAANEEMKSTNEEYLSANEELQSTNEELETAKEELQSVNEELQTVNAELQAKNEILAQSNADLSNLLSNIEIAIIFLDQQLRIKRFNPAATQIINLISTDVGRPINHLVSNLMYDRLIDDIRDVLNTLIPKDVKVQLRNDGWYLMRIRVYRSANNAVDGIILIFTDLAEQESA
jgi:two-component system CheB/CheR fusion protein